MANTQDDEEAVLTEVVTLLPAPGLQEDDLDPIFDPTADPTSSVKPSSRLPAARNPPQFVKPTLGEVTAAGMTLRCTSACTCCTGGPGYGTATPTTTAPSTRRPPRVTNGASISSTQRRIEKNPDFNIEEFGYFGFLDRFENGSNDSLMWLGGKVAKHSATAKGSTGPVQEDLSVLLIKDHSRYDRVIARALDPQQIDEDGYGSIPELLEQAQLVDPTRPAHQRLTDKVLARIKLDVCTTPPPVSTWIGNRSRGLSPDEDEEKLPAGSSGESDDDTDTVSDKENPSTTKPKAPPSNTDSSPTSAKDDKSTNSVSRIS
ncbi:unnamed protein product [Phytophthora fragariaefolia]|uniref:Unnamed protein product n=1 Tax=Phytophthora fragariaefolia TaxID=1490495 RepID=A0A9W7D1Q1_9STRA|nr:unnamed protein product [Phytophthora fragariaefolia]